MDRKDIKWVYKILKTDLIDEFIGKNVKNLKHDTKSVLFHSKYVYSEPKRGQESEPHSAHFPRPSHIKMLVLNLFFLNVPFSVVFKHFSKIWPR